MSTNTRNRRIDSIRVRLSPEMMERFENLASRYGMPPATLCAFAVARFVQQEETNAQLARMVVLDASRRSGDRLEEVFSEDNLEKIFGPMLKALMEHMYPELIQALQQKSPSLDGEASREDA